MRKSLPVISAGCGRHHVNGCQTQITSFVSAGFVRFMKG